VKGRLTLISLRGFRQSELTRYTFCRIGCQKEKALELAFKGFGITGGSGEIRTRDIDLYQIKV